MFMWALPTCLLLVCLNTVSIHGLWFSHVDDLHSFLNSKLQLRVVCISISTSILSVQPVESSTLVCHPYIWGCYFSLQVEVICYLIPDVYTSSSFVSAFSLYPRPRVFPEPEALREKQEQLWVIANKKEVKHIAGVDLCPSDTVELSPRWLHS